MIEFLAPRTGAQNARGARGLTNSVQFAIAMPVLMILSLGIIQGGVWLHGRHVAAEAANAAADIARGYRADDRSARQAAVRIADIGGLHGVRVGIERTGTTVEATLSARAPLIFDIGLGRISETATAPRELITRP